MRSRLGATGAALSAVALTALLLSACGGSSQAGTVATGRVTCTTVTGSATFNPPLTLVGSSPETLKIALHASDCTTSQSNVAQVTGATAQATSKSGTNGCESLAMTRALSVTVHWTPSTITPSVVSFSGFSPGESATGALGFTFPGSDSTAKTTGSFAGSDNGASSTAAAYTAQGTTQLVAACSTPAGIASIPISSGHVTLG
jgi:hypothetical protein